MHLVQGFWTSLIYVARLFSLSPIEGPAIGEQIPMGLHPDGSNVAESLGPIFKPPGGSLTGDGSDFSCNYSKMVGWSFCSTPENRTCWLKKDGTNETLDIFKDYESIAPNGTERFYEIDVTDDHVINADGVDFNASKLFDRMYPGTWIQACWGDVRICLII